jgi:hypothetical protein
MQSAADKFKDLKNELAELTQRITSMQGSYEKDIRNLTDVLSKVSENAPKDEIEKKLNKLSD